MKVYIASMFSDKDRVKARVLELKALGIDCTSRWADETVPHNVTLKDCTDEYLRETAVADLVDILRADVVVLTVPEPQLLVDATVAASSRGGRHFESGFAYGISVAQTIKEIAVPESICRPLRVMTVGPKENIFHHLEAVANCATLNMPLPRSAGAILAACAFPASA